MGTRESLLAQQQVLDATRAGVGGEHRSSLGGAIGRAMPHWVGDGLIEGPSEAVWQLGSTTWAKGVFATGPGVDRT